MESVKKDFLTILASKTPEEITELIFQKSKIKPVKNVVVRINGYSNNK